LSYGWDLSGISTVGQGSSLELTYKAQNVQLRFKNKENKKKLDENK
jgi:hypothetical protein